MTAEEQKRISEQSVHELEMALKLKGIDFWGLPEETGILLIEAFTAGTAFGVRQIMGIIKHG